MRLVLWIAIAGAAGTLARWGLSSAVQRSFPGAMPWGTWAVNVLGCFLFAIVWSLANERSILSKDQSVALLTGFMGAFTTFSTLIFESERLATGTGFLWAAANVAGQTAAGFTALALGYWVVRLIG